MYRRIDDKVLSGDVETKGDQSAESKGKGKEKKKKKEITGILVLLAFEATSQALPWPLRSNQRTMEWKRGIVRAIFVIYRGLINRLMKQ